jgi:hypothetical protein
MTDSISRVAGEYVTSGIQALREDITDELKVHGKARVTFTIGYTQLNTGEIDVELTRRLAHSADVVKTSVGRLSQQALPGM